MMEYNIDPVRRCKFDIVFLWIRMKKIDVSMKLRLQKVMRGKIKIHTH